MISSGRDKAWKYRFPAWSVVFEHVSSEVAVSLVTFVVQTRDHSLIAFSPSVFVQASIRGAQAGRGLSSASLRHQNQLSITVRRRCSMK